MALFFYQFTPLYGHNQDFGGFDLGFTDKCPKNSLLSVNSPHNGQKFTDKSPKNDGLSVKYVLLTDKSAKKGTLSVKFERNLGVPPRTRENPHQSRHGFKSLFS